MFHYQGTQLGSTTMWSFFACLVDGFEWDDLSELEILSLIQSQAWNARSCWP